MSKLIAASTKRDTDTSSDDAVTATDEDHDAVALPEIDAWSVSADSNGLDLFIAFIGYKFRGNVFYVC